MREQVLTAGVVVLLSGLALVLGLFGASLLFGNGGPGETEQSRLVSIVLYYAVAGLPFGLVAGRYWFLAAVIGWFPLLLAFLALTILSLSEPFSFLRPFLYVALVLLALLMSWLGYYLRQRLLRLIR